MAIRKIVVVAAMVLACALVGGCTDTGSDTPQTYRLSMTEFGCAHERTLARVAQLDAQGDQAAAIDYDRQNFLTGECIEFSKGTIVFVDDMHPLDGIDQVHAQGSPDDYWIASSVVTLADAASSAPIASTGTPDEVDSTAHEQSAAPPQQITDAFVTSLVGHSTVFKPTMPSEWSQQKKGDVREALTSLYHACPALTAWRDDMQDSHVELDDLRQPMNSYEREVLAPMGWTHVLVVDIDTIQKPHDPIFHGEFAGVDFYIGAGKRTGIFMQGGYFPLAACGGKPTYTYRTQLDRSYDKAVAPDTFIAAPALNALRKF